VSITIREEQDAWSSTAAISFTTGAGTALTDRLVVVQWNDFYTTANLTTPSGTAGLGWTLQHTGDGGTDAAHVKVWTSDVAAAGARTVDINSTTTDEERYAALFVLTGVAAGTDGAASTMNGSASTSHVAPSVTPVSGQSDDLLIVVWTNSNTFNSDINYTPPGSMTAYTERDSGGFGSWRAASEALLSAGASGTRTATASLSCGFHAVSVLVKSAATSATSLLPYDHRRRRPLLVR
jgi:hypothetical protein